MPRIPKTVFISYRRTNQAHAIKIYQLLQEAGYDPFLDVKDLGAGAWRAIIQREIQRRAHFVLLLTPSAVQRFTEPNDVMRFEIETALDSKRNLVPLMFEGFSYSDPRIHDYLTGKLAILSEYNAFPINWRRLKKDIQDLIDRFLSVHPDDVVHPDTVLRGGFGVGRGIPNDVRQRDEADISPELAVGDMPDWLADEEEAETSAKEAPDDGYARQPATSPTMLPTQPAARKAGKTSWLMAILGAPIALVNGVYLALRDLLRPQPVTDDTQLNLPQPSSPPIATPTPVPPPQSALGEIDMTEADMLLMMRQAMANLPPVSDDQLALEEAEERG